MGVRNSDQSAKPGTALQEQTTREANGRAKVRKGIGREFMEKTMYRHLEVPDQMRGLPPPALELDYARDRRTLSLPPPVDVSVKDIILKDAIEGRRSIRKYTTEPLSMGELSYLLYATQGVKRIVSTISSIRTVPSAGARHALETYLLINNVVDLSPGLYRFLAFGHRLVEVNLAQEIADLLVEGCFGQEFVKQSAVTFIWSAVPYRMNWRYGERGYRYLLLDAGHVCQNLYLAAQTVDCGVCAIAAFEDDTMNRILGIDGENQFVVYTATVGKKENCVA